MGTQYRHMNTRTWEPKHLPLRLGFCIWDKTTNCIHYMHDWETMKQKIPTSSTKWPNCLHDTHFVSFFFPLNFNPDTCTIKIIQQWQSLNTKILKSATWTYILVPMVAHTIGIITIENCSLWNYHNSQSKSQSRHKSWFWIASLLNIGPGFCACEFLAR